MADTKIQLDPCQWVQRYGDYLYNIARFKVNDLENAEDLVQETFLSALKSKDNFQAKSSEKTWLTSILNNKIIDYYRSKKIISDLDHYLDSTEEGFTNSFFEPNEKNHLHWKIDKEGIEWKEDVTELLDNEDFYLVFMNCIDKLPIKLSAIIKSKFLNHEGSEEICKAMDISSSNYFVIVHRSKILLRECLDVNWFRHENR